MSVKSVLEQCACTIAEKMPPRKGRIDAFASSPTFFAAILIQFLARLCHFWKFCQEESPLIYLKPWSMPNILDLADVGKQPKLVPINGLLDKQLTYYVN